MVHDTSELVLMALYKESQKEFPNYVSNVTAATCGITEYEFLEAVKALKANGYIRGLRFIYVDQIDGPAKANISNVELTQSGITYAEKLSRC
jgi:YjcQ protein